MVFVKGTYRRPRQQFEWIDAEGNRKLVEGLQPDNYGAWFNISPDGNYLAYHLTKEIESDIWKFRFGDNSPIRLTHTEGNELWPVWSPDGKYIAYSHDTESAPRNIHLFSNDTGISQSLISDATNLGVWDWCRNGQFLVLSSFQTKNFRMLKIPMDGSDEEGWKAGTLEVFEERFFPWAPSFSPDGNWIAYGSNKSGSTQIFIEPFPEGGTGIPVSDISKNCASPRWLQTENGVELVFADAIKRQLIRSKIDLRQDPPHAETPIPWKAHTLDSDPFARNYDLHPDGRVLVLSKAPENTNQINDRVIIYENFAGKLRELFQQK
jgi:Tol biopolymer transport system component